MRIKRLADGIINRIAAGEVIERPASVVKELVENSIDAQATHISVNVEDGGKNLIRIVDDGYGMGPDDIEMAIERHATSKLKDDDIFAISTLGFRGEALPSIGSIARLTIISREKGSDNAFQICIDGGKKNLVQPASLVKGTTIEVRDLFYATPARLKFLKSERSENIAISETLKRLAMAHPEVGFTLKNRQKTVFDYLANTSDDNGYLARLSDIMGKEFSENSVKVFAKRDGIIINGYAGLPTLNRSIAQSQFMFVDGRPVQDKLLLGAVRAAYADFLARNRYPMLALFIELEPKNVDVNVHPAKAEVRFRNQVLVRSLVVSAIKNALENAGHSASTTVAATAINMFRPESSEALPITDNINKQYQGEYGRGKINPSISKQSLLWQAPKEKIDNINSGFSEDAAVYSGYSNNHLSCDNFNQETDEITPNVDSFYSCDNRANLDDRYETAKQKPLGVPRAQLHENYIISQTEDGLVIVDQHAAHERLVYERIKKQFYDQDIKRQILLVPEIVEMAQDEVQRIVARIGDLGDFGLIIEPFGDNAVAIREVPAILGNTDVKSLIRNLVDDLVEYDSVASLKERIEEIIATIACHGSVRSGRLLKAEEMNELLREMETTPHSGQCNHGRPTYVELKKSDIEKLFGRS